MLKKAHFGEGILRGSGNNWISLISLELQLTYIHQITKAITDKTKKQILATHNC
jgi:hypothetical protein